MGSGEVWCDGLRVELARREWALLAALIQAQGRVLSTANETTLREATDKVMEGVRAIESVLASVAVDSGPTIVADTQKGATHTADGKASGGHDDKLTTNEEPSAGTAPGQVDPGNEDQKAAPPVDLEAATLTYYTRLYGGQEGA